MAVESVKGLDLRPFRVVAAVSGTGRNSD
jgi:hypothetical protein